MWSSGPGTRVSTTSLRVQERAIRLPGLNNPRAWFACDAGVGRLGDRRPSDQARRRRRELACDPAGLQPLSEGEAAAVDPGRTRVHEAVTPPRARTRGRGARVSRGAGQAGL